MVKVRKHGIILESTNREFESHSVLNPATIREGDDVHMFYRAVKEGNCSSIGYARFDGPLDIAERAKKPVLSPKYKYDKQGMEDPRIVRIGDTYYMTYVAYDGKDTITAYATSRDLKKFKRKGIITPRMSYNVAGRLMHESEVKEKYFWFESYYKDTIGEDILLRDKDVFFFPKKIRGKFVVFHRIIPDIQLAFFRSFSELNNGFWKDYLRNISKHVILEPRYWHESRNIGGGCPPVETKKGWVVIYHAVEDSNQGKTYHAAAALLDRRDPRKVIGHLKKPLFSPEEEWECRGVVDRVVFPTGTAVFGKRLYIYYGAADKVVAVASVRLDNLAEEMLNNGARHGFRCLGTCKNKK
jgi:predicted GH43/DUF377 family glycosyl hydrolase